MDLLPNHNVANSVSGTQDALVTMGNSLPNLQEAQDGEAEAYLTLYDYAIPTVGVFIVLINLSVVLSSGLIIRKGVEPRFTYLFLGNLAMADLVTGLSVLFGQVYPRKHRNHTACAIQIGMIVSSILASVYSVGLLAIDRFLYIVYGIKYCTWISVKRVRLVIVLTWILAVTIGFLPLMGKSGDTRNGRICWFITVAPNEVIILTVTIGLIPIILVFILYSIILYHAINKINKIQDSVNAIFTISEKIEPMDNLRKFKGTVELPMKRTTPRRKMSNSQIPNKWKAVKIVMFTTLSFLFTWTPYFAACVTYVLHDCDIDDPTEFCKNLRLVIASPLTILGCLNSLINPHIYAWWHNGFRTFVSEKIKIYCRYASRRESV